MLFYVQEGRKQRVQGLEQQVGWWGSRVQGEGGWGWVGLIGLWWFGSDVSSCKGGHSRGKCRGDSLCRGLKFELIWQKCIKTNFEILKWATQGSIAQNISNWLIPPVAVTWSTQYRWGRGQGYSRPLDMCLRCVLVVYCLQLYRLTYLNLYPHRDPQGCPQACLSCW